MDGRAYPMESGCLSITRPWQSHRVGNPNVRASRLHWVILDVGVRRPNQNWQWPDWLILLPDDLRQLTNLLRHNEHPVWKVDSQIGNCFERTAALVTANQPKMAQTRLRLCLNELLVSVMEMLQSPKGDFGRETFHYATHGGDVPQLPPGPTRPPMDPRRNVCPMRIGTNALCGLLPPDRQRCANGILVELPCGGSAAAVTPGIDAKHQ